MTSWRDHLLARFPASPGHLILAADPDALLREEQMLAALSACGYDLLTFDDPIAFRYAYESRYRIHEPGASQAPGASARPALIVRTDRPDLRSLPYDLLTASRPLTLSLRDLLPGLSYPVARDFFRAAPELLDRLLAACRDVPGPRLGDQRSLAFITGDGRAEDRAVVGRLGRAGGGRGEGGLSSRRADRYRASRIRSVAIGNPSQISARRPTDLRASASAGAFRVHGAVATELKPASAPRGSRVRKAPKL